MMVVWQTRPVAGREPNQRPRSSDGAIPMHSDPETGYLVSQWHARTQQREATRRFQASQASQVSQADRTERTSRRVPAATALRRVVGTWMVQAGYRLLPDPKGHTGASPAA